MKLTLNITKPLKYLVFKTKPKTMVNINAGAKTGSEPFCRSYWRTMKEKGLLSLSGEKSVSQHSLLNGINHHFISHAHPEYLDVPACNSKLTPRQMISLTDLEFKKLQPIKENMTVYRCIGEKPTFFTEYPLYKKRLSVKPNDIIDMKEYAYATSDISYAERYMPNMQGIEYEIHVPQGSKISVIGHGKTDEVVFPRSSRFKCVAAKRIKNDNQNFLRVILQYIMPQF